MTRCMCAEFGWWLLQWRSLLSNPVVDPQTLCVTQSSGLAEFGTAPVGDAYGCLLWHFAGTTASA